MPAARLLNVAVFPLVLFGEIEAGAIIWKARGSVPLEAVATRSAVWKLQFTLVSAKSRSSGGLTGAILTGLVWKIQPLASRMVIV